MFIFVFIPAKIVTALLDDGLARFKRLWSAFTSREFSHTRQFLRAKLICISHGLAGGRQASETEAGPKWPPTWLPLGALFSSLSNFLRDLIQ